MKVRFKQPYADADRAFKVGTEFDFIDARQARRFVDAGIALPMEDMTPETEPEAEAHEPAPVIDLDAVRRKATDNDWVQCVPTRQAGNKDHKRKRNK